MTTKAKKTDPNWPGDRAVELALRLLNFGWFGGKLPRGIDPASFAKLLFSLHHLHMQNELVSRKKAAQLMGAESNATGKKYIDLAFDLGLLDILNHPEDARVQLVALTFKGRIFIEEEARRFCLAIEIN